MDIQSSNNAVKRLLIAEDEESNFELLRAMLRKRDIEVVWAKTGTEALQFCEEGSFGLILMDIKMPSMDGYEAISRLRELGVETPVIAQTAYARIEDEEQALKKGFDGYVSKPIDRNKLLEIIDKYLG